MNNSRIYNTKRNLFFSYFEMILNTIFMLLLRWMTVYVFGDQYLGLSSLFTSILQVLSVAELGFSSAITFNLYKPLSDNDVIKVRAIMFYFKKIYRNIGTIIAFLGILLIPFLKKVRCQRKLIYIFYTDCF